MRLMRVAVTVLGASLLLSAPADAAKQTKTYAPPGKAGSSQYAEVVPTSGGNAQTPAMGGGNKTAAQISQVGAGRIGVNKLSKLGKQGAAAAQLAQQTAPVVIHSRHGLEGQRARTPHPVPLAAAGGSALGGISHLLGGSDSGGIGLFLPLLLAFGLGAAVAMAVLRLRRSRDDAPPGV